jgi:hypothetical protein
MTGSALEDHWPGSSQCRTPNLGSHHKEGVRSATMRKEFLIFFEETQTFVRTCRGSDLRDQVRARSQMGESWSSSLTTLLHVWRPFNNVRPTGCFYNPLFWIRRWSSANSISCIRLGIWMDWSFLSTKLSISIKIQSKNRSEQSAWRSDRLTSYSSTRHLARF